jgi:2-keto-4-pentenoate hydratase/2-oxohepta-3-ene-1,7-dioic acid hydratase in catechol pathway
MPKIFFAGGGDKMAISSLIERQKGNTSNMIHGIPALLMEVSKVWKLCPGDILFTGTPAGVGPLSIGDTLEIYGDGIGTFSWSVIK